MPKILANNLEEHQATVWSSIIEALEYLLENSSYDDISFASIARQMGIARNTLYNYAPDKASLIAQAALKANEGMLDLVDAEFAGTGTPPERLQSMLSSIISSFAQNERCRHLMVQAQLNAQSAASFVEATAAVSQLTKKVITEGIEQNYFQPLSYMDFTIELIANLVRSAVAKAIKHPEQLDSIRNETNRFVLAALSHQATTA